ncbi:MAG: amidohydrolase [Gammaproteobacteria bacterium]|nr:amidohydrolase [Gammaproteobacteria bacterium]
MGVPVTRRLLPAVLLLAAAQGSSANVTGDELDAAAAALQSRVIVWRRDFHLHPELGNREIRTSARVAEHLRELGLEVRTGMAHTGVVAVVEGALPGPTLLLRADMDALPITEKTDVPFRSTATGEFRGQTVGVMHACGHDAHTAILMGVAEALVRFRDRLPGRVLLVFQPAEEGAPEGERGGAPLMLDEGLLAIAQPDAAFALHVGSMLNTGQVMLRPGPLMAGSDFFRILVTGRQSHGARPWKGIDPIVVAAEIVSALQTIVSRQLDITDLPAVVTVGAINGGVRHNIIPDTVEMLGTIRTFSDASRQDVIERMRRTTSNVAAASGATATLEFMPVRNPPVVNDPALTERVTRSLKRALGDNAVGTSPPLTVGEDFAHIARAVPSVYWFVGVTPAGTDPDQAPDNHSESFFVDEAGIQVGLRSLLHVAVDFLQAGRGQ